MVSLVDGAVVDGSVVVGAVVVGSVVGADVEELGIVVGTVGKGIPLVVGAMVVVAAVVVGLGAVVVGLTVVAGAFGDAALAVVGGVGGRAVVAATVGLGFGRRAVVGAGFCGAPEPGTVTLSGGERAVALGGVVVASDEPDGSEENKSAIVVDELAVVVTGSNSRGVGGADGPDNKVAATHITPETASTPTTTGSARGIALSMPRDPAGESSRP